MTIEEFKKKAAYLRSIGQGVLADDYEQLITRINELELETKRLRSLLPLVLGDVR